MTPLVKLMIPMIPRPTLKMMYPVIPSKRISKEISSYWQNIKKILKGVAGQG